MKADGYGHGMVPAARAALDGGAAWLGVADLDEAVALRRAGITAPVLCMMTFGDPAEAVRHDIDLAAGSADYVARVEAAAVRAGVRARARLHLKADTGLSRGGATPADWPGVVAAALAAQARGSVRVVGLWSHFACADIPGTRRSPPSSPRSPTRLRWPRRPRHPRGQAHRQHGRRADRAGVPV